ncbi:ionotropic receptor 25a-like [Liolophura sinensis]|uniref:ionotropic receptor 25a-like n=1 Tax=Liolophura sinensis TaxID=3198878 RepID=UPI0031583B4F
MFVTAGSVDIPRPNSLLQWIGVMISRLPEVETIKVINEALRSDCLQNVGNISLQTEMELIWHYTNETNGFLSSFELCRLMEMEIDGLISVLDCRSQLFVADQADVLKLPHVLVSRETCYCREDTPYVRNVNPSHSTKAALLKDLIVYTKWFHFVFIFDESIGIPERRDALFALSEIQVESTIIVINSTAHGSEVYRKLDNVKKDRVTQFVVWALKSTCQNVFSAASTLKMITPEYYWIMFQPDTLPFPSQQLFLGHSPSNAVVISRVSLYPSHQSCLGWGQEIKRGLLSDIVDAILMLSASFRLHAVSVTRRKCAHGVETSGEEYAFSGFPTEGASRWTQYDLHSVTSHPFVQLVSVAKWREGTGLSIHSQVGLFVNKFRDFKQQLIRVTAKQEVAMAIGPFSITALRDTVIDYTKPYMDDSIGILTRKPQRGANLFQMMRPFSTNVWVCIVVVILLGAVLLTVINRLTPYGKRHPGDQDFVVDEHSFSQNLWIIYMSVVEQGAVYIPAANSSRCILGFWWIFTILIIATYTANLAAFLTVADPPPAINTLAQLLQQKDLGVLVQDGSNLWSMFKDSKTDIYQEMWKRLQGSPSVDGLDAALPYVRTGKYAYVGDRSTLEYVAAQECHTFVMAEESFNAGTYGLVMTEDSPFKEAMDYFIMKMLEAGLLTNWRQKWWARADNCTSKSRTGSASGLSLDTLGGVFIVYLACAGLAVIILLVSIIGSSKCGGTQNRNCARKKDDHQNIAHQNGGQTAI